jgi:enolase-phosphatase E1
MQIKYILSDIEGTTTAVTFVYEVLFPYFRSNISKLKDLKHIPEVVHSFEETIELAKELENTDLKSTDEIIDMLLKWSKEDKKITPLKTLQGILWEEAYKSGEIKGHVYEDVKPAFESWKNQGLKIGIFSSGSVQAQKLIFANSESGDLTPYLSNYFDTTTGMKRDFATYRKISELIDIKPENILFLSDIVEELEAADQAGFQTSLLLREGNSNNWKHKVNSFLEIIQQSNNPTPDSYRD